MQIDYRTAVLGCLPLLLLYCASYAVAAIGKPFETSSGTITALYSACAALALASVTALAASRILKTDAKTSAAAGTAIGIAVVFISVYLWASAVSGALGEGFEDPMQTLQQAIDADATAAIHSPLLVKLSIPARRSIDEIEIELAVGKGSKTTRERLAAAFPSLPNNRSVSFDCTAVSEYGECSHGRIRNNGETPAELDAIVSCSVEHGTHACIIRFQPASETPETPLPEMFAEYPRETIKEFEERMNATINEWEARAAPLKTENPLQAVLRAFSKDSQYKIVSDTITSIVKLGLLFNGVNFVWDEAAQLRLNQRDGMPFDDGATDFSTRFENLRQKALQLQSEIDSRQAALPDGTGLFEYSAQERGERSLFLNFAFTELKEQEAEMRSPCKAFGTVPSQPTENNLFKLRAITECLQSTRSNAE